MRERERFKDDSYILGFNTGSIEAGGAISLRWENCGGGAGLRGISEARVLGAEVEMPCRHPSRGFGRLTGHMRLEFQKEVQDRELNVRASAQRGCLKS